MTIYISNMTTYIFNMTQVIKIYIQFVTWVVNYQKLPEFKIHEDTKTL